MRGGKAGRSELTAVEMKQHPISPKCLYKYVFKRELSSLTHVRGKMERVIDMKKKGRKAEPSDFWGNWGGKRREDIRCWHEKRWKGKEETISWLIVFPFFFFLYSMRARARVLKFLFQGRPTNHAIEKKRKKGFFVLRSVREFHLSTPLPPSSMYVGAV